MRVSRYEASSENLSHYSGSKKTSLLIITFTEDLYQSISLNEFNTRPKVYDQTRTHCFVVMFKYFINPDLTSFSIKNKQNRVSYKASTVERSVRI